MALDDGIAVDPNQPVRVALLVPLGSGDPGRDVIARSLVNAAQLAQADVRNATIDLVVYPDAGTAAGGAAAAQPGGRGGRQDHRRPAVSAPRPPGRSRSRRAAG